MSKKYDLKFLDALNPELHEIMAIYAETTGITEQGNKVVAYIMGLEEKGCPREKITALQAIDMAFTSFRAQKLRELNKPKD